MKDAVLFKQTLVECRQNYVEMRNLIKNYLERDVKIQNPKLDLPKHIDTYKVEEIDISENVVTLIWFDEDEEEWILEDMTISEFVQNAEFL